MCYTVCVIIVCVLGSLCVLYGLCDRVCAWKSLCVGGVSVCYMACVIEFVPGRVCVLGGFLCAVWLV